MKLFLRLGILMTSLGCGSAGAQSWWSIDQSKSYTDSSGGQVTPIVLTMDLRKARLRLVSVPFETKGQIGSTEVSLRDFAQRRWSQEQYRIKEWIAVNGGFSSYRVDVPLGLLVTNGKVYSTLSAEKRRTTETSVSGEFGQYRWSGILCQLKERGTWDIVASARYEAGKCQQALQAGPVAVAPVGRIAISQAESVREAAYRRTVVCLIDDTAMKVVLAPKETHLYSMAQWMSKSESSGGLGCRVALNLSGDTSSGIAISSPPKPGLMFYGEGSFPLATVLLFEKQ